MNRLPARVVMVAVVAVAGCASGDVVPGFSPDGTSPGVKAPAAAPACAVIAGKADRKCTPGVVNPNVTQANIKTTICTPGWTKTVRPPAAYTNLLKTSQLRVYGETGAPADYKEDHLIPLEAGGNPTDPKNLFPQPNTDAAVKDRDENTAHADVCSGRKSLVAAQQWIVAKWTHP